MVCSIFVLQLIIYTLLKNESSIHEYLFPTIPTNWENKELNDKWKQLFKIKQVTNIAIEEKEQIKKLDLVWKQR